MSAFVPTGRVTVLDLPGHGESDKPKAEYTQEYLARGVDAVLRDAGVSKAYVIAHSMWMSVARYFVQAHPEKVIALVNVDSRSLFYAESTDTGKAQRAQFAKALRAPQAAQAWQERIERFFVPETPRVALQANLIVMTDDLMSALSGDSSKTTCFVMMPFGLPFDRYYRNIFAPAIKDAGLKPVRGDEIFGPSAIVGDIWELLTTSALALADLSGRNPNVFYELGLAHAIGKPVILVASNPSDVPFDLNGLRVIAYDKDDEDWGTTLRKAITQSVNQVRDDPKRAVPSTFIRRVKPDYPTADAVELELRQLANEVRAISQTVSTALNSGRRLSAGLRHDASEQIIAAVFPRARSIGLNWAQVRHIIDSLRSGLKSEAVNYIVATRVIRGDAEAVVDFIQGQL